MNRRKRRAFAVIVAAVLCSAGGVAAATGTEAATDRQAQAGSVTPPAFVVALHGDGSADVTVTYTFDLTDEARGDAFEELRANASAEREFEDRFRRQLQGVASAAANATGREMSITAVDVGFETSGDTGVVRVTATWEGLAATEGGGLTVTEPFASGFEPDRQFAVFAPDGYAVDAVAPAPDERADRRLVWSAGASLEGFELSASPTQEGSSAGGGEGDSGNSGSTGDETPGGSGPGFGVAVGVAALLGAGLRARRR